MQKNAEKANANAEASSMKAKLLSTSEHEESNDLIAAAMKQAQAGTQISCSITERLASLKNKK